MHLVGREETGIAGHHIERLTSHLDMGSAFQQVARLFDTGVGMGQGSTALMQRSHQHFHLLGADGLGTNQSLIVGVMMIGGLIGRNIGSAD